ncbi:MAG: hypothetical protein GY696_11410 [Gammaproteobacteria bacterium]|nr:hypothetical protein [Gammaproteobacteria bacterium]
MPTKQMTERQRYWLSHVKAADVSNGTTVAYAKAHDLRLKTLYQYKSKLIKLGLYKGDKQPSNFLPVRLPSPEVSNTPVCTIFLSNGSRIEFSNEFNHRSLRTLITSAGLRG